MNAAKHTPGPWEFDADTGWIQKVVHKTKNSQRVHILASVGFEGELHDVDRADGHLIAAAPDLLAALQDLTENRWDHYNDTLWANALAAIAKATGADIV